MNLSAVPNVICVMRMALAVPIVWLLAEGHYGATLLLFGIAAASDGLDGYLAKTFNWTSELGKVLDPVADKLLLVSVFITLTWLGLVPLWLAAVAVGRDVIIGVGAWVYKEMFGPVEGRPTMPSKLNTLIQLLFVIAVVGRAAYPNVPEWLIITLGAMVFVTTVVSGVDYIRIYARKAIAVSRARRPAV
ncbi:MAG: CDP-alcohol phosphatidyltransferase family protein [Gammaproteobacteria bacterium]|nr:CDP-alcohol phosphatidyltransferase family protein [Gammaproteobacteria bacterium]